jgi:hypothetical protein
VLEGEDAELLLRYRTATYVPPERFPALARARAEAVSARLVAGHGLPPEPLRLADETDADQMGVRVVFEAR